MLKKFPTFMESEISLRIHKIVPLASSPSQLNPVKTLIPYLCKTHFNIVPICTWESQVLWSRIPTAMSYAFLNCREFYIPQPTEDTNRLVFG